MQDTQLIVVFLSTKTINHINILTIADGGGISAPRSIKIVETEIAGYLEHSTMFGNDFLMNI